MFGIYVNPGKFLNHSVSDVPLVFPFFLILSLFPIIFLLFVFYKKKIVVFTPLSRTRQDFSIQKRLKKIVYNTLEETNSYDMTKSSQRKLYLDSLTRKIYMKFFDSASKFCVNSNSVIIFIICYAHFTCAYDQMRD